MNQTTSACGQSQLPTSCLATRVPEEPHLTPVSSASMYWSGPQKTPSTHTRQGLQGIFSLWLNLLGWSLSGCDIRYSVHLMVQSPQAPCHPSTAAHPSPGTCGLPAAQLSAEDEGQRCKRRAGAPSTQLGFTGGQMDRFISQNSLPRTLPYGAIKKGLDPRNF